MINLDRLRTIHAVWHYSTGEVPVSVCISSTQFVELWKHMKKTCNSSPDYLKNVDGIECEGVVVYGETVIIRNNEPMQAPPIVMSRR